MIQLLKLSILVICCSSCALINVDGDKQVIRFVDVYGEPVSEVLALNFTNFDLLHKIRLTADISNEDGYVDGYYSKKSLFYKPGYYPGRFIYSKKTGNSRIIQLIKKTGSNQINYKSYKVPMTYTSKDDGKYLPFEIPNTNLSSEIKYFGLKATVHFRVSSEKKNLYIAKHFYHDNHKPGVAASVLEKYNNLAFYLEEKPGQYVKIQLSSSRVSRSVMHGPGNYTTMTDVIVKITDIVDLNSLIIVPHDNPYEWKKPVHGCSRTIQNDYFWKMFKRLGSKPLSLIKEKISLYLSDDIFHETHKRYWLNCISAVVKRQGTPGS